MIENLKGKNKPRSDLWKTSVKALDEEPDKMEDGMGLVIDGSMTMKQGKYKTGATCLSTIYEEDKSYVDWVRTHITPTSGMDLQALKVYVLTRDQAKMDRLTMEENKFKMMKPKAKPAQSTGPMSATPKMSRPREETAETMEWGFVDMNQGRQIIVTEMVDGVPIHHADPTAPNLTPRARALLKEMINLILEVETP